MDIYATETFLNDDREREGYNSIMEETLIMVFRRQLSCLIFLSILLSTTVVSAKVIKKSSPLPSGNREYVFVRDGEEVAQQIVDEVSGEVVVTNGSIPDGPVHEYNSGGGLKVYLAVQGWVIGGNYQRI